MIKIDLKLMKAPLILYCAMTTVFVLLLCFFPHVFLPTQMGEGFIKTTIFYYTDFFLPLLAACCIIMQLGSFLEKNTFMFICSVNNNNKILFRWLFTVMFIFVLHFISSLFAYGTLTNSFEMLISFSRYIFLSTANLIFFCSGALLLSILFRQIFYVFSVLIGYAFIDFFFIKEEFSSISLFVNISPKCSIEDINHNRIAFYAISTVFTLICAIIEKINLLQRLNKRV